MYLDTNHCVDDTENVSCQALDETAVCMHDSYNVTQDHIPSEIVPDVSHSATEVVGIPIDTEADEIHANDSLTLTHSSAVFMDAVNTEQYLPPEPEEQPDLVAEDAQFDQADEGKILVNRALVTGSEAEIKDSETLTDLQEDTAEVKFKIGEFEEPAVEDKEEPSPSSPEATGN
jgi:hypothetical protein